MDHNFSNESSFDTREEYIAKLKKWIEDARKQNEQVIAFWQNIANQPPFRQNVPILNTVTDPQSPPVPMRAYIYKIPPIWKRLLAEIIDFFILFVIKFLLALIVVESGDKIDIDAVSFTGLQIKLQDPQITMQTFLEILTLELLHRCIVSCYETYWIVVQRATPGKRYMGLAVVEAINIVHVEGQLDETVMVTPSKTLSIKDAFLRSLLKSVFIGFLLPICFVFLFFKFKRTGYDLLTKSLVVEYDPDHPLHNHEIR